jgi:DNA-binding NarL/FixJ family response regulator
MHILILDDDPAVLAAMVRLVSHIFTTPDVEPTIVEANTASRAIAILATIQVDLAILDVDLGGEPRQSGEDVLRWIAGAQPELLEHTVMISGRPYSGHPNSIMKGAPPAEIKAYLRRLMASGTFQE